jgi:hypothetical protein
MRAALSLLLLAASCSANTVFAASVPFDLASGRPVVELTVNDGGPYRFVFDTGCPGLIVGRSLVEEASLEIVGDTEVQSPLQGAPVAAQLARVPSIELGGARVTDLEAIVLDVPGLDAGVVGPSVFRGHGPLTLDFAEQTITIGGALGEAGSWLPFGESAPLLDAPVRIGDVVLDGHVDTGSPDVLAVPARLADRLPLTGPVRTVGRARTVDAEFEIRAAPIETSARVGDAEIPLSEVRIAELPVANLGTGGLLGLKLQIDWERERFALTGKAAPAPAAGPRTRVVAAGEGPRFGVRAAPSPDGTIEVVGTDPGSAAEAIGLLAGDRIVAINGKPTAQLERARIRQELAADGLELEVERDGKKLVLKRPS